MSNKYDGMTVNERLFASNLMDEFYQAINDKNFERVKEVLEEIELDKESIDSIIKEYGFN